MCNVQIYLNCLQFRFPSEAAEVTVSPRTTMTGRTGKSLVVTMTTTTMTAVTARVRSRTEVGTATTTMMTTGQARRKRRTALGHGHDARTVPGPGTVNVTDPVTVPATRTRISPAAVTKGRTRAAVMGRRRVTGVIGTTRGRPQGARRARHLHRLHPWRAPTRPHRARPLVAARSITVMNPGTKRASSLVL